MDNQWYTTSRIFNMKLIRRYQSHFRRINSRNLDSYTSIAKTIIFAYQQLGQTKPSTNHQNWLVNHHDISHHFTKVVTRVESHLLNSQWGCSHNSHSTVCYICLHSQNDFHISTQFNHGFFHLGDFPSFTHDKISSLRTCQQALVPTYYYQYQVILVRFLFPEKNSTVR